MGRAGFVRSSARSGYARTTTPQLAQSQMMTGTSLLLGGPEGQVPGGVLPFTCAFSASWAYSTTSASKLSVECGSPAPVDFIALASNKRAGITITEAATSLFGSATINQRAFAA